jgi:hypothetical protein
VKPAEVIGRPFSVKPAEVMDRTFTEKPAEVIDRPFSEKPAEVIDRPFSEKPVRSQFRDPFTGFPKYFAELASRTTKRSHASVAWNTAWHGIRECSSAIRNMSANLRTGIIRLESAGDQRTSYPENSRRDLPLPGRINSRESPEGGKLE